MSTSDDTNENTVSSYQIKGWNPVMFNTNITRVPSIYIEPDISFLEFVRENQYRIIAKISECGNSSYEDKLIVGYVNKSADVPNCRPNFYAETGFYIISLESNWDGYPPKLGTVEFYGFS